VKKIMAILTPNQMEEGSEKLGRGENSEREEIYSRSVRAGKRTYFFDVRATRRNDFYLTITESIKKFNDDGRYYFEKHKIFLYKEDFERFVDGLIDMVDYIHEHQDEFGNLDGNVQDDDFQDEYQDSGNSEFEEVEVEVDGNSYPKADYDELDEKHQKSRK
jgi:hypothetical protein